MSDLREKWAQPDFAKLQQTVGYRFTDPSLLSTALTHSSYLNEHRGNGGVKSCNERLEFLGDSVLSLITSEYIYEKHPDRSEGELSVLRSRAVCTEALAGYAAEIALGDYLLLGNGEEHSGGRSKPKTLENSFEALVGALYLDGGLEIAKRFALPFLVKKTESALREKEIRDYKTLLQQIVQQDREEHLEYVLVGESGPAHQKTFEVEARLNSNIIGHGVGSSKRAAEQAAAKEALILFGQKEP